MTRKEMRTRRKADRAAKDAQAVCDGCCKAARCFERRGACNDYKGLDEIAREIKEVNDEWERYFGTGNSTRLYGGGRNHGQEGPGR